MLIKVLSQHADCKWSSLMHDFSTSGSWRRATLTLDCHFLELEELDAETEVFIHLFITVVVL